MGLDDIIKEIWDTGKYILKKPLITLTTLAVLSTFSCNKSDPTGPGGGGGSGGTSGTTNSSGQVSLTINSNNFNVNVRDEDGASLSGISVEGQYNGGGKYEFLAEDFSYDYFSETAYYPQGSTINGVVTDIDINAWLSEINPYSFGDYVIKIEPAPFNTPHQNLDFVGTTTLSDLYDFYQDHDDAIMQNTSVLEFISESSDNTLIKFALKAAKFRNDILENATNVSEIITFICDQFGQTYDPDAYYFDVYRNSMRVLTHFESQYPYCTVKGHVYNGYNSVSLSNVAISVLIGQSNGNTTTNSSGNYTLKFLLEDDYTFHYSKSGYEDVNLFRNIYAPTPPFYSSSTVNVTMYPETTSLDTIIIQPNSSSGKDSYSSVWSSTPNYGDATHGNEDILYIGRTTSGIPIDYEGYIQFSLSSVPSNFYIDKAELRLKGGMYAFNNVEIDLNRIMDSWSESTVCYNNKPSSVDYNDYWFNTSSNPSSYEYVMDVTSLVTMWYNGNVANNGLKLDIPTGTSGYEKYTCFKSSDASNSSDRPKLYVIGYQE